MRHTDVLLGIKAPKQPQVTRTNKDELKHKFVLANDLRSSEGWLFFVSELQNEEQRLLAMIEKTENPTQLAKLNGTLLAVKSFINWPDYVSKELDAQMKDLEIDLATGAE